MAKKVLITGVNGFLGSALWTYLRAQKFSFQVFGIDRRLSSTSRRVFSCDLNRKREVSRIIFRLRPDYIFHLAGGRVSTEKDLIRNNVLATMSLLEAVAGITDYRPRIIIPGSAAEYGKAVLPARPVRETAAERPVSFYGFVKSMQTNLGLMYARAGLDVVITRVFNICGYGTPPTLSLGQFSRQISFIEKGKRRPVIRTGNLGMKRDFLDVRDICSAFLNVARAGKSKEIYNICSGNSYLMRDLLSELTGYSRVGHVAIQEEHDKMSGIDISIGSNAKIRRATGWAPEVDIHRSLRDTLRYYRKLPFKP